MATISTPWSWPARPTAAPTWNGQGVIKNGWATGTLEDKNFYSIDTNAGSPFFGRHYTCWDRSNNEKLAYSSNNGATWTEVDHGLGHGQLTAIQAALPPGRSLRRAATFFPHGAGLGSTAPRKRRTLTASSSSRAAASGSCPASASISR